MTRGRPPRPGRLAPAEAEAAARGMRNLRRASGRSQAHHAALLNVTRPWWTRREMGEMPMTKDEAEAVAGVLGTDTAGLQAAAYCGRCHGQPAPWTGCLACGAKGTRT